MTPHTFRRLALWLGAISSTAILLSLLALQDISKAIEPDLSMEWSVVRTTFLIMIAFHVVALLALRRSQRA